MVGRPRITRREFFSRFLRRIAGFSAIALLKEDRAWAHPTGSVEFRKDPRYISIFSELKQTHGFAQKELENIFSRARIIPEIPGKYEKPPERLPYHEYRQRFITPEVVSKGKEYLRRNRVSLLQLGQAYPVDPAVIAAILGVESKFGRRTDGGYRVFDALNTALTLIPQRERFAQKELIEFLLLCRDEGLDPSTVKGSYAGAMGAPQFIPSSFRRFAVDGDGDGKRDLWRSDGDIQASVANYLKLHGWEKGAPIRLKVRPGPEDPAVRQLLDQGMKGRTTPEQFSKLGLAWAGDGVAVNEGQEFSLMSYPLERGEQWVAIFSNFRAILRYNPSFNYALVVTELSEQLAIT